MLKGKSTIELFDSVTGKKKEEYKDENIVTNAINNLLDWNGEMLASGVAVNDMLARLTPLYPNYLRGVLLWDDIIQENQNNILPPPGINCLGHAGGHYGAENPLRGTWNQNETVVKENSVKMVWDFATDKANGVIKSISLTSSAGGDRGWMTPGEAGTFFRQRINNGSSSQSLVHFAPSVVNSVTNTSTTYVGELRKGIHTHILDRNDNSLTIVEQSYANPEALSIFDSAGLLTSSQPHCKEELFTVASDERFSNLATNFIIDKDYNLVHVSLSGTGNRNVRIRTVNLITKQVIDDRRVTLDRNVQASPAAYFKNRIYATVASAGIHAFNEGGVSSGLVAGNNVTSSTMRYWCFAGDYLASPTVSATNNLFIIDGINAVFTQAGNDVVNQMNLCNSSSMKLPLITLLHESSANSYPKSIFYVTPYMATINNLQMPVTKTELNSMKITYELIQE
ncbi:MAG: hypothetical protein FWD48_06365 [Oscillospiraceae bacterium]|nr:hypothetical protein [Oscillospiraceae bacterium]